MDHIPLCQIRISVELHWLKHFAEGNCSNSSVVPIGLMMSKRFFKLALTRFGPNSKLIEHFFFYFSD